MARMTAVKIFALAATTAVLVLFGSNPVQADTAPTPPPAPAAVTPSPTPDNNPWD